ncbi:hypothetical protein ACF3NG_05545 [Aerococcaceae bacterium WGS1372]
MKSTRKMLLIATLVFLIIPLTAHCTIAQSFEKIEIEETIKDLSILMENSFEFDDKVKDVWLDYVELLNKAEFQDYTKEDALNTGSSYEDIKEFFSPDAEESILEFRDYEQEFIYQYETDNLEELSIHLYFYNGGIYASSIITNLVAVSADQLLDLETVNKIIAPGWPKMDTLIEENPTVVGIINMVKDDQLGSIIAYPSGNSLDESMLEFTSYEGDMPTSTIYFTHENYIGINDGSLQPMPAQFLYYATLDFIPQKSLRELVNRNTTQNQGYRIASEQLTYLLDSFVVRGLVDNVPGSSIEEVKSDYDVDVEAIELEGLESPLTGLAYQFPDPNNANNLGVLTLYFYDNQLAFLSIEEVRSGWRSASVNYDYSKGIQESDIHKGETLTYLTQMNIQVPAIGIMVKDASAHQVAVIPVKDSEKEVFFVDISDYKIENSTVFEITEDTGELSDDLFDYIFNQYQ